MSSAAVPSIQTTNGAVPIQGQSPSLAASIDSLGRFPAPPSADLASSLTSMPSISGVSGGANGFPKTANFLNQLESMMSAVKKEAGALESMKQKLKDMEELKTKYFDLKTKLQDSEREIVDLKRKVRDGEQQNNDIKHDLQTLNNLYNNDRAKFIELQQIHARMEQEFANMAMEKEFLIKETQKIPELKKAIKQSKSNLQLLKTSAEEEKNSLLSQISELEKKNDKQEKSKSEISQHVWQLTEQIDNLKLALEEKMQVIKSTEDKHQEYRRNSSLTKERYMMVVEDYKVFMEMRKWKIRDLEEENQQLKTDKETLTWTLARKEDELSITSKKLVLIQESYEEASKMMNKSTSSLQETIKDLSSKNSILVQELSTLKQQSIAKAEDIEKLQAELSRFHHANQALVSQNSQKELEYQHDLKTLASLKDELSFKLQSTSAQLEELTNQNKINQQKYRDEINQLKNNESQLIEEAEKISAELQDKIVYIQQLEFEKQHYTKNMQSELTDGSKMIQTLKEELEKRLAELMTLRQDKDALQKLKENLESSTEDLKQELKKQEETFKRTIETERSKLKQELLSRQQRIKVLESEKSELLHETQELMLQLTEGQKSLTRFKSQLEENEQAQKSMMQQLDMSNSRVQELTSELKKMLSTEQDLRDLIKKQEEQSHEELRKFDLLLKESKKSSSQQVVDLNNQIRGLLDEVEVLKRNLYEFHEKEKRWESEKERSKIEIEKLHQQIQDSNDQSNKELYNIKRECNDLRNKQKIINEQKAKLEMEAMQVRLQYGALENELVKAKDNLKMVDQQHANAVDQCKSFQQQIDQLVIQKQQLQNRVGELENLVNHKATAIEHLNSDFQQLERENVLEIRRLKLSLSNTEQEINELRPLNHQLSKELNDCKSQLSRLQMQSNSSMSNMLEEVRKVEDLLSKERKHRQQENEEHRRQVKDMELLLEKSRYELDDYHNKMRSERQEKEIKISQYEEEIGRLRNLIGEKDNRIEELEGAQHTHRKTVLTFQEKIDGMESELSEVKSRLDTETNHRKRLEHRMRSMLSTAEMNDLNVGGSSNIYSTTGSNYNPPRSRQGSNILPPSVNTTAPMLSGESYHHNTGFGSGVNNNQNSDNDDLNNGILFQNSLMTARSNHTFASTRVDSFRAESTSVRERSVNMVANYDTSQGSFSSPPRHNNSNAMANNSPAVDRVSAALALKLAQQNRSVNSNSGNTMRQSRPGSTGYFEDPSDNKLFDDESTIGNNNSIVEESIRRTQMVINRRLGLDHQQPATNLSSVHDTPKQVQNNLTGSSSVKTPNSGRSTSSSKLHEAVQQAHTMYPSSPVRIQKDVEEIDSQFEVANSLDVDVDMQDEDDEENVGEYNLDESVSRFLMPTKDLRPISPPPIYGSNVANSTPLTAGASTAATGKVGAKKKKKKKSNQQLPKI